MESTYLLWKVLHIISFTAWMAAMFYLPRLYVYHADVAKGGEQDALFQVMERRLLRAIATPAMVLTLLCGGMLVRYADAASSGWFHAKMALVLALAGFHGACAVWRKGFVKGENRHGSTFYRIVNEVPTVLLIGIVLLAVMKPF